MQLRRKHIKILLLFLSIAMVCIWCYAIYLISITYKYFSMIGNNFDAIVPDVITSPDKYEEIRRDPKNMEPNSLINHFPLQIPNNAENVKMSALQGFLQGGAHFQVRFQLPSDEIDLLYEKYNHESKASYVGGGKKSNMGYGSNGSNLVKDEYSSARPSFHTSDNDIYEFPDDYTIFIIDAEPYKRNDWNHGYSRGVVISKERNEILYYEEDW